MEKKGHKRIGTVLTVLAFVLAGSAGIAGAAVADDGPTAPLDAAGHQGSSCSFEGNLGVYSGRTCWFTIELSGWWKVEMVAQAVGVVDCNIDGGPPEGWGVNGCTGEAWVEGPAVVSCSIEGHQGTVFVGGVGGCSYS